MQNMFIFKEFISISLNRDTSMGPLRPTEREGGSAGIQTNKQVESCFLNHNSSIQFCCTDSLLMTHHGGLSLSIIIWRIGGGAKFHFALGSTNSLPLICQ